jgi:hypothetical protein
MAGASPVRIASVTHRDYIDRMNAIVDGIEYAVLTDAHAP